MTIYIVVGLQYGDEGKGKIAATLPGIYNISIAARAGVGPNAGHGVRYKGREIEFRHISAASIDESIELTVIGPGTAIDPQVLYEEIKTLEGLGVKIKNKLKIDKRCPIIEERHKLQESKGSYLYNLGSMCSGSGALHSERAIRSKDIKFAEEELQEYSSDVPKLLYEAIKDRKNVLIEGTQGYGLSLFHGEYPYVTSKDTTASQLLADLGIPPVYLTVVVGCIKPYTTRAGAGPLKGEGSKEVAHIVEKEIRPGVLVGEKRRVGEFDWELVEEASRVNGVSYFAITNLDRRYPQDYKKKDFEELSKDARKFIDELEDRLEIPVGIISTGPELEDVIVNDFISFVE